MINEEIAVIREKLNNMISNGEKPEAIYAVSTELDELIVKYYKENK